MIHAASKLTKRRLPLRPVSRSANGRDAGVGADEGGADCGADCGASAGYSEGDGDDISLMQNPDSFADVEGYSS